MILNQHNVRNELYMTELVDLDFRPIARVFTPNNGHVLAMVFRIAKWPWPWPKMLKTMSEMDSPHPN